MGITRKSLFGLPPRPNQGSTQTVRLVPLTQGVRLDAPWPNQPPGSSTSMTNFLPVDGCLIPRSRLSSMNTLRTLPGTIAIADLQLLGSTSPHVWISGGTLHGRLNSNGSISLASFTSASGLGVAGLPTQTQWSYAQTFDANLSDNMLVAAGAGGSLNTLLALYTTGGVLRASYLTSAPKAYYVTTFDNYVVAWNIGDAASSNAFDTRVQWCVRGNASNWTSEGSGFEDLLQMKGYGTAIKTTPDGRIILFGSHQIWYGVGATYPSQFQFFVLDPGVGCHASRTIQATDLGFIFVGSDGALRVLPKGGGPSQVVVPSLTKLLRRNLSSIGLLSSAWGVYDSVTRLYYLFLAPGTVSVVINVDTGEWGYTEYPPGSPSAPVAALDLLQCQRFYGVQTVENLFFINSAGTVYSTDSRLASDSTPLSVVTSKWQSPPLGSDLPGNYKQLTNLNLDYRATSKSTVTLKISQDGGNNYEATGVAMSLGTAPVSGRVNQDVYRGGAFPTVELTSTSTGYELHRLDVTIHLGGRA